MSNKKIGILVGSLRKESFSKKIANELLTMTPEGFEFSIIPIGQLPLYNQDFDDHHELPDTYIEFRNNINQSEGFIFVTPEYNRSLPAVLKNAMDVASRPSGKNFWNEKPAAIISNSPGSLSGFGANHHLRQVSTFLNLYMMQQPEMYLGKIADSFDESGNLTNEKTKVFLENFMKAYIKWFHFFK